MSTHFTHTTRINAGLSALKSGKPELAKTEFQHILRSGNHSASAFVGLAMSCIALNQQEEADQALDKALLLEPRNLWALILKGDQHAALGNTPAATSHYLSALKMAPPSEQLPGELANALVRVKKVCDAHQSAFEELLRKRLSSLASIQPVSDRFEESVDLMFGRRHIYHSSPKYFHFPGLPSISFHEKAQFDWVSDLEAATANIRNELLPLLTESSGFRPYIESRQGFPIKSQDGLLDNPDWSAFYLIRNGVTEEDNAARCPATMQALSRVPLTDIPNRSPSVLFSLLRPGAHIPPHCGLINTRLICHLPLVVPSGCEFRVGNDVRSWREGNAWLFDDTIEHEAWNRSNETRVILLFEVWRPEIAENERESIRTLFRAVDEHTGTVPTWEI